MKGSVWGWLGACIVVALGCAHLGWTVWWVMHAERAVGVAGHTSYSTSSTAKSAGSHVVHVTYTTASGEGKTVGLKVWSRNSYPEGSSVPVIYEPGKPGTTRLDHFVDLWLAPMAVLGWGLFWVYRLVRR